MNVIHPTAVIDEKAKMGDGNYIGPYCYIGPEVDLGSNNRLEGYVSVGTAAEHRDYFREAPGNVKIGSGNIIREFVTINGGTSGTTTIGDRNTLLRGSHLGHDVVVANDCNFSCNVLVGGHSIIEEGANLGLSAVIHQHRVVGAYAMVGMNSAVTKNILPFVVAFGSPCLPQKINRVGLLRSGLNEGEIQVFESWYQRLAGIYDHLPILNHSYQRFLESYETRKSELLKILGR